MFTICSIADEHPRQGRVPRAPLGFPIDPPHIAGMTSTDDDDSEPQPVMLPFRDKDGPGWHVIIRYPAGHARHPEGHERRIDGFSSEQEALGWIVENAGELEE